MSLGINISKLHAMCHVHKMSTYQLKYINFSHKTKKSIDEHGNNFNDFTSIMSVHMKKTKTLGQ